MVYGKFLKNKSLNKKIIIYQMTIMDRILAVLSCILFIFLPIFGLISGFEQVIEMIIFLLAMIAYSVYIFFCVFKTYICFDIKKNKLIIRESPGFKKEELVLEYILSIGVSDVTYLKKEFTIDINMPGYTKRINSWSGPSPFNISLFGSYKSQTKRLKKFCEKCNEYLNKKN